MSLPEWDLELGLKVFVAFPVEVQALMMAFGGRIAMVWHRSYQIVSGPAIATADAFVAGAADVTSTCRAPRSSESDATQQQDVARTARAAASGTVCSTFVLASRISRTSVDLVHPFAASGWKPENWTAASGSLRSADTTDGRLLPASLPCSRSVLMMRSSPRHYCCCTG